MRRSVVRKIRRRKFLEGLAAAGVVAAVAPLVSCGGDDIHSLPEASQTGSGSTVTVYRFQTLKSDRCNACRNHQHYKVYLDPSVADLNRAHSGCNCRIVAQQVTQAYYDSIAPYVIGGAVDLRAVYV